MPDQPVAGSEFLSDARKFFRGLVSWLAEEEHEGEHPGGASTVDAKQAAGVAFVAPDGKMLFMRRAADRDMPGTWAFPAGMKEGNETPDVTAAREAHEETGRDCGRLHPMDHQVVDDVDFSTFLHPVNEPFTPHLTPEHTEHAWAWPHTPPAPLHPGVAATLSDYTQDPLTEKGQKILRAMTDKYGEEKGKQVFYASRNKGTIEGVDNTAKDDELSTRFELLPGGHQMKDKTTGQLFDVDQAVRALFSKDVAVKEPNVEGEQPNKIWKSPPQPPVVRDWTRQPPVRDAGTSEGARKAAATRAAHGGGVASVKPTANPHGTTRYAHLLHRYEGGGAPLSEKEGHEFGKLHQEHTEGKANHLAPPSAPTHRVGYRASLFSNTHNEILRRRR